MSIPRRLGRLARGFVGSLQDDDRFRETLRTGRERGETLREAFGEAFEAAWRGAAEEWRTASEETPPDPEEPTAEGYAGGRRASSRSYGRQSSSATFAPRKYPLNVLSAYNRLGLSPGAGMVEVGRKRRELVKRYHPDRFTDAGERARAERLTAEINAAYDTIARHLLNRK